MTKEQDPKQARKPAIDALSSATNRYVRAARRGRTSHRKPSLILATIAAAAVGAVLIWAQRPQYRCVADLRVVGDASWSQETGYRKELLDYAWEQMSGDPELAEGHGGWSVDSPGAGRLRFLLITEDRTAGLTTVRDIAEGYRDRIKALATTAHETPTEAETILAKSVSDLQESQRDAEGLVDAALASLPATDPSNHRNELVENWRGLRSAFDNSREQLARASTDLSVLESQPDPTHGTVSGKEREQVWQADVELQQDLAELEVNLTELKLHLLNVWQRSSGPLERLILSTDVLIEKASAPPKSTGNPTGADRENPLSTAAKSYRTALGAFRQGWDREFTALRRLEVDPVSGALLDAYHRVQRHLNDFLFGAAKQLAVVRSAVRTLDNSSRDTARTHVFQSNLVRAFHATQAAHHQFEFAAETIETPENFRLDIALKSGRGLRRRSQARIRSIEQRLQTLSAERARTQHTRDLTTAERFMTQTRSTTDKTVDELVALQDELNLSAGQSEDFLRATVKTEVATERLQVIHSELTRTQERLRKLGDKRMSPKDKPHVEIVSCEVLGGPVNLGRRLGIGGVAAVLSGLAALFAQWWITRRVGSDPVA